MIILDSTITNVTVFSDRAQVQRVSNNKLAAGQHKLVFDFLPDKIEESSIQVSGKGDYLIQDVQFKTVNYSEVPNEKVKEIFRDKEGLLEQINEIQDKLDSIDNEKNFIHDITKKLTEKGETVKNFELNPENWMKMVEFYRTRSDKLNQEMRFFNKEMTKLNNQIKKIDLDLRAFTNTSKKVKRRVEVLVELSAEKEILISISYLVKGPSWKPIYDIRVDSTEKQLELAYHALITQETGEDWKDVNLKISTARPAIGGTPPKLYPWRVDIYRPPIEPDAKKLSKGGFSMGSAVKLKSDHKERERSIDAELNEHMKDAPAKKPETTVSTGATSVVFSISGNSTIFSDNQPYKSTILMHSYKAEFEHSCIPKLSPYAYLKAKIKNATAYPLLPGETNIYMDSSFIANSSLHLIQPDKEFIISLGVDEAIKVEHELVNKFHKKEGIISKKDKLIYEYQLKITNNKKTEVKITVKDQLPISQHQDIEVEIIQPEMKQSNGDIKISKTKIIEWKKNIPASQKQIIPFSFFVEYPKGMQISGL